MSKQLSLRPGIVTEHKRYAVQTHFTNGFAQDVYELADGTVIYISYSGTQVVIEKRELMTDPATEVPTVVNQTDEQ